MGFSNLTLLLLTFTLLTATTSASTFNCTTPTSATSNCHALIDFVPTNATTLNAVKTLFNITHLRTLLGANNLPLSTRSDQPVPANKKLLVPFSCTCFNGSGVSNRRPVYTVKAGDGLDYIASLFSRLVTFQEIARVNGIPDPDQIEVGQKLWIPLPCSCDHVDGEQVVHYGHVVDPGSSVQLIADEYGTTQETLLRINGIADASKLQAGQVIDVPLKARGTTKVSTPSGSLKAEVEFLSDCEIDWLDSWRRRSFFKGFDREGVSAAVVGCGVDVSGQGAVEAASLASVDRVMALRLMARGPRFLDKDRFKIAAVVDVGVLLPASVTPSAGKRRLVALGRVWIWAFRPGSGLGLKGASGPVVKLYPTFAEAGPVKGNSTT